MQFGTWLHATRSLEREAGVDHREMACYASLLTPYIRDHMSRALQSMEELYSQLPSPAYEEAQQREIWEELRDPYIRRMREALDHIGAALNAVGCTDEQLAHAEQCDDEKENDMPSEDDGDDGDESQETTQLALSDIQRAVDEKSEK